MCSQLLVSEPLWANLPFSCDFIERHRLDPSLKIGTVLFASIFFYVFYFIL